MIFPLSIIVAISCGGKKKNSSESRSEGARLFALSCQTCHALPRPAMKTDEEWPSIVDRYGPRAMLNKTEIAAITLYLVSNN